jgi:hypothetical protein
MKKELAAALVFIILAIFAGAGYYMNKVPSVQESPTTTHMPNDEVESVDDWDWDVGQDCGGLTQPEECDDIEWPVSYGCRIAGKHNCLECLAEKTENASVCEMIVSDDVEAQDFHRNNCFWRLVVHLYKTGKRGEIDFCTRIPDEARRIECYKESSIGCGKYRVDECPEDCTVCPPCEACSSIACRSTEFCENIGFDKDWWERVRPKED